jgi:hypothetical protein
MATYVFRVNGTTHAYEVGDAAWRFYEACTDDPSLNELAIALTTADAVAELGRSRGFGTAAGEIQHLVEVLDLEAEMRREAGELTDEELDMVAGGSGTGSPQLPKPPCIVNCNSFRGS